MAERESSNAEEAANVVTQRRSKRKRVIPRKSLDFVTLQQQADEDSSTSTPASEESDRPVAAGKGKKRVSVAAKARGGKRGSRKTRGRCFEGDEEERLVLLHEQRKKQADDMINRLSSQEAKELLKEIAARQPAIILDVAAMLSTRQPVEDQPGPSADQPSWCVCRHCPMMDRDQDKICCGMAPQYCDSQRPEMGLVITDPLTLHIQQTYRNDVFAHQAVDVEDTNRSFRHAAYRQYVLWIHGRLQRDDRRTVPACCVQVVLAKFPSLTGNYTGFIPGRGVGW